MNKYLCIDYGLVHIGLATSEYTLATPLPSLRNTPNLLSNLSLLVKKEGVTHIICGIPEGKLAPIITDFSTKLSQLVGLPVTLHPETLSSQEAQQKLKDGGSSRAKRKDDHSYAACLILEDYLELTTTP